MNKLFLIVLALMFFGCDSNPSSSGEVIPDALEVCNNTYDSITGDFISCDSDCLEVDDSVVD